MSDKKDFLEKFKKTVKNEGGDLSFAYILERINKGDVSESDIAAFKRYIPLTLASSIERIMSKRRLLGILKAAEDTLKYKRTVSAITPVKDVLDMIKQDVITQDDIQRIKLTDKTEVKKELAKQIDRFLKSVLLYKTMAKEDMNKQKFKIERMLRKKVVTANYLDGKANIKDIVQELFGKDYKRYLSEEPYEMEIKEAISEGLLDDTNVEYLPQEYVKYMDKKSSSVSDGKYKRRKMSKSSTKDVKLSDEELKNMASELLSSLSKKTTKSQIKMKSQSVFSDEGLLKKLAEMDKKDDKKAMSDLSRKLMQIGFETKAPRGKAGSSKLSSIKKQIIKSSEKARDEASKIMAPPKRKTATRSLYSIERKLEDIKSGKKTTFLSKIDKSILEEKMAKQLEKEITTYKKSNKSKGPMDIDLKQVSPASSRRSSTSSNGMSVGSSRRSSVGSSRKSSVSSRESVESYKSTKDTAPSKVPEYLIQLGVTSTEGLDPESIRIPESFVKKSIPFVGGKRKRKDSVKLKIDKESLEKSLKEELEREETAVMTRPKRKTSDAKLSPYIYVPYVPDNQS